VIHKKKNKKSRKSLEKLHHEGPCVPVFQVLAAPGVLERFIKDHVCLCFRCWQRPVCWRDSSRTMCSCVSGVGSARCAGEIHQGPCVPVFQVLAAPGVLERFIKDQAVIAEMRSMFVGLYQLTPVCGHMPTLLLFDLSTARPPDLVCMIYASLA